MTAKTARSSFAHSFAFFCAQDEAAGEYADGAYPAAPAAIADAPWDAADVAGYDGSAPAAGQWSEQAAAGWDAAAPPAAVDFNTGAMEFSTGGYA